MGAVRGTAGLEVLLFPLPPGVEGGAGRQVSPQGEKMLGPQMERSQTLQEFMELLFLQTGILRLGMTMWMQNCCLLWDLLDKSRFVWSSDQQQPPHHLGVC